MAATETLTYQDTLDSQYLSSSLSSLSRSRSANSLIVRAYKQATQLYITQRFKEALETLEPIITPQQPSPGNEEDNGESAHQTTGVALVAQSSRGTRTKVWVFYLSLLNAIVDLGPEEGKLVFGSTRWRELANKARQGSVWAEIVQAGYGGVEGAVDTDVIVNLATLLLTHMPGQKLTQQRLEAWLAACDGTGAGHHVNFADGVMSPGSNSHSTPKALATRLKVLELYALHVLPANGEWTYAREFIEVNDTLDEERKEAFLHALQELKEEQDGTAQRERELAEQREREMEERKRQDDAAKAEDARRRREEEGRKADAKSLSAPAPPPTPAPAHANGSASTRSRVSVGEAAKSPTHSQQHQPIPSSRPAAEAQKKSATAPPPNLYRLASSALNHLQQMVLRAGRNMTAPSSVALLRLLMFLIAFLVLVSRRDLRLRVQRAVEDGWVKVKRTVGMGVKVSYI